MRVAIAGDSTRSFYLWQALEAGRDEANAPVEAVAPSFDVVTLSEAVAADLSSHAVVVIDETAGLDRGTRRRLVERVEAGGGMLVVAGPRIDPALVRDLSGPDRPLRLEPARTRPAGGLLVTDPRHPVFRAWRGSLGALGQTQMRETRQLADEAGRVLATFADGSAALKELEVGRGRLMILASDLNGDWNDLPRRPTFVPLVHELVRHLAGPREDRGEITVDDLPAGMSAQIGVATHPETGERVVVNVDTRESDPEVLADPASMLSTVARPPAPAAATEAPTAGDQLEAEQGLWWIALLVVGGLLMAESWLGRNMS